MGKVSTYKSNIKTAWLFFIPYTLYLICRLIDASTFQIIFDPTNWANWAVRILAACLVAVKLILEFKDWKKYAYIYLPLFIAFLLATYISKNTILLDVFILLIGAWNIDLKEIVAQYVKITVPLMLVFMVLTIVGVIPDAFITNEFGGISRHAMGSISPTDFAASIFYLQMSIAFICKKSDGIWFLAISFFVAVILYYLTKARLDVALIIMFAFIWYYKDKKVKFYKFETFVLKYSMLLCCAASFLLHALFVNNGPLTKLNLILSNRLYLGKNALEIYGLKLFGSDFDMYGLGWSIEETGDYNFVDCGFLYVGLQYGMVILVAILLGYFIYSKKEVKDKKYHIPIIVSFIALSSCVDHHIFQLAYNSFMFILPMAIKLYPRNFTLNIHDVLLLAKRHFSKSKVEYL